MCREDVSIGRRSYSRTSVMTVPDATKQLLVGEAKNRTAIIISANINGGYVAWSDDAVVAGNGIAFTGAIYPLQLTLANIGNRVTFPLFGSGNGGPTTFFIVETFFDDGKLP